MMSAISSDAIKSDRLGAGAQAAAKSRVAIKQKKISLTVVFI
jgi:hypothetical protein